MFQRAVQKVMVVLVPTVFQYSSTMMVVGIHTTVVAWKQKHGRRREREGRKKPSLLLLLSSFLPCLLTFAPCREPKNVKGKRSVLAKSTQA